MKIISKKVLSLLLVLAMFLSLTPSVLAAEADQGYTAALSEEIPEAGSQVVIYHRTSSSAMGLFGKPTKPKFYATTPLTTDDVTLQEDSSQAVFTIGQEGDSYLFTKNDKYLGIYNDDGEIKLTLCKEKDDTCLWTVTPFNGTDGADGYYIINANVPNAYLECFEGTFMLYEFKEKYKGCMNMRFYVVGGEAPAQEDPYAGWDRISVFETADIHGFLMDVSSFNPDTFQYRLPYIAKKLAEARAENPDLLLLDGGDIYQGQPVSNRTFGASLRAAMDAMNYDAVALGNHEFDWDVDQYAADAQGTMPEYALTGYEGDSTIPVLCDTLYYKDSGERVEFTQDYIVVQKGGYRVLVAGYAPDYSLDIMTEKVEAYSFDAPAGELTTENIQAFNDRVKAYQEKEDADVVVVLAHEDARELSEFLDPEVVDLVCGGHSHKSYAAVASNGVPYLEASKQGKSYATADIMIDPATGDVAVTNLKYEEVIRELNLENLYSTDDKSDAENFDADVLAISKAAWASVEEDMTKPLGYVTSTIDKDYIDGSRLNSTGGNLLSWLMRMPTGSDVAFVNGGGIRVTWELDASLGKRNISTADIYTIIPFDNPLPVFDVSGAQLAELFRQALTYQTEDLQFSGCDVEYYEQNGENVISKITLSDGRKVDIHSDEKLYTVCTNEFVATLPDSPFVLMGLERNNEDKELIDNECAVAYLEEAGYSADGGKEIPVDALAHIKQVEVPETEAVVETTELTEAPTEAPAEAPAEAGSVNVAVIILAVGALVVVILLISRRKQRTK